jgi:Transketolase
LVNRGKKSRLQWQKKAGNKINKLSQDNSKLLNNIFTNAKITAVKDAKPTATRKSSEDILTLLTTEISELIGGSADLAGSNNTKTESQKIIKPGDFSGTYIHYGVREHAMAAIMNGIALHDNLIPYGGTF